MNLGLVGMDPRISLFLPCPCFVMCSVQTHASVGRNVNSNKPQPRPAVSSQAVQCWPHQSFRAESSSLSPDNGAKNGFRQKNGTDACYCVYAGLVQFKVAPKTSSVRILELGSLLGALRRKEKVKS